MHCISRVLTSRKRNDMSHMRVFQRLISEYDVASYFSSIHKIIALNKRILFFYSVKILFQKRNYKKKKLDISENL